jgi:hypothetical protein
MLEFHIIYLLFTICICGYKVRLFSTYLDNNLIQYYISIIRNMNIINIKLVRHITLSIKMGDHLEVQLVNPDIISIPSLGNRWA